MRIYRGVLLVAALSLVRLASAATDPATVDVKALAENGAKSLQKLRSTSATWTVANTLSSGSVLQVSVVRAADKERTVVSIHHGGKRVEIVRIVSRDGLWYVTDRNGSSKYRPYEAPADNPIIYSVMDRSEPRFISAADQLPDGKLEGIDRNIATFRRSFPPAQAAQMKAALEQLKLIPEKSGQPLTADAQAQMTFMSDLLAHGVPFRIDLTTGQLVDFGTDKLRTRVTDFRFLHEVPENEFDVDGEHWQDFSDDPTAGNLDDLVMIEHAPGIKVGMKNYELDGRLMDVKTGRFRRIPFPGGAVLPGCFLKDRRSVVVNGLDSENGSLRPYRLDLKTRKCDPLGGPLLDSGSTLGADLSPDGKTVVVTHVDPAAGMLNFQICLIDLATGKAKPLGKPHDTFFVNWTADGQHLALLSRTPKNWLSPSVGTLALMDMDGKLTELRKGEMPVLLADRQTTLFQDADTDLWHTCDLRGQNVKLYADGLKGYGFPSPAPDGKRLLMMHFIPGKLPEPIILPIGESQGRAITDVGGLWASPQWR